MPSRPLLYNSVNQKVIFFLNAQRGKIKNIWIKFVILTKEESFNNNRFFTLFLNFVRKLLLFVQNDKMRI